MVPSKEVVKCIVDDLQNWETTVLKQTNNEKMVEEILEIFGNKLGNEVIENGKNLIRLYSQLNAIVSKRFIEVDYDLNKLKGLEARAYDILVGVLTLIRKPSHPNVEHVRRLIGVLEKRVLDA